MGIFFDILVVLGISIVVLLIGLRLKVPLIIGFLITGILAGPHGFGLINAIEEINVLSEIGVVLLLFTIGVELSLRSLLQMRRMFLVGGLLQVSATTTVAALILVQLNLSLTEAAIIGFCVSLSSTAIVLRILQSKREIDAPQGRIAVSILVFQDLATVPVLLFIPLIAGVEAGTESNAGTMLLQAIAMIGFVWVASRWMIPRLFKAIAATRNRELFLISALVLCFGVSMLAAQLGLSLALGAFLAGLLISESEYSYQVLGNITPLRDLFTSFFFVAIGLLLDVQYVLSHPLLIIGLTLGLLLVKSLITTLISIVLGYPIRPSLLAGLSLGQTGEFAFIVCGAAVAATVVSDGSYQTFLAVSALSMGTTPFLISLAPRLADKAASIPRLAQLRQAGKMDAATQDRLVDHLIIIGYGVNGANVARASANAGIPYVIVEMNPETIKRAKEEGQPIYLGDASQLPIWETVSVEDAKIAVIAISDLEATRKAVSMAHSCNPDLNIVARTRYLNEIDTLYKLGACEVIPEEFETSVEIFSRVLRYFLVPETEIDDTINQIRAENYQLLRKAAAPGNMLQLESSLGDMKASTIRIGKNAPAVGKSLTDLRLRSNYSVTVLMVKRGDSVPSSPEVDMPFAGDDLIVLYGDDGKLKQAIELFR